MTGSPALPTVTVAVLNHRRPHLLQRVLTGVLQLDYPAFEIVVVGDRAALSDYGLPGRMAQAVRYFACGEANICRARNIAVAGAAGEVVAFCDDDAVPEPDWLAELAAPFADPAVGAAGGVVRAADGLALEWQGGLFDRAGTEFPLGSPPESGGEVQVMQAAPQLAGGRFLSLRGVNSAFRRAAVVAAGGFDEAYRYYLDETDMALRLAEAGWSAALVRSAEVQHLPEENVARGALRQPRDLFEVAASKTHFCRRHLPPGRIEPELAIYRARQMRDLDTHMRLGVLRRADRTRLARRFDEGVADGQGRAPALPLDAEAAARPFVACPAVAGRLSIALVTGWGLLRIARLRAVARQLAAAGHSVSCFSYMTGPHAPRVSFEDGVWLHRGGTWRLDNPMGGATGGRRVFGRGARARAEIARVMERRRFNLVLRPAPDSADAGGSAALLPVAGMSTPLRVELARDCDMDLAGIVLELRRIIDLPRPPAVVAEATGDAAGDTGLGAPVGGVALVPGSAAR